MPFELNETKKFGAQVLQSTKADNLTTCFGQTFLVWNGSTVTTEALKIFYTKERKKFQENVLFRFPTVTLDKVEQMKPCDLDLGPLIDKVADNAKHFAPSRDFTKVEVVINLVLWRFKHCRR